jgi:hypothetical protein
LLDNKPLFTRTLLEKAAKDVEQARDPKGWDSTIVIPHVRGHGSLTVKIPDRYCLRDLQFSHAFDTSRLYGACAPYFICPDRDGTQVASEHTLKPNEPQHPLRQLIARSPDPPRMQEMQAQEVELLASSFWEALKLRLEKLYIKVENFVCAALGNAYLCDKGTGNGIHTELNLRRMSQHLFACAISNFLSQRYANTSPGSKKREIPIISYDPGYELSSMHMLSRLSPPIDIVSSPHHFLSVTPNTLVLMIAMPAFVSFPEVIADVLFPGGPAAMICNEIFEYPFHAKGLNIRLDQWTPRVGRMLEKCEHSWLGHAWNVTDSKHMQWMEGMHLYARHQ